MTRKRERNNTKQRFFFITDPLLKNLLVNPVRSSSGALNPAGIILKSNPASAAGPGSAQEGLLPRREDLWPGGSSRALFLTG